MRINLRFQPWLMGLTLVLVVLLSVTFLVTVFKTFKDVAEERALGRFELIAGQIWTQLDGLVQTSGRFVNAQVEGEAAQFVSPTGRLNQNDMVSALISSVTVDSNVYAHYFGLENGEFLQVIGVRGDEAIRKALNAPDGTHFAIRRITQEAASRMEAWQFLDARRQTLGRREQGAQYVPASRPWYVKASAASELVVTDPYLFASNGELGITVARVLPERLGVFATDISLRSLQQLIESLALPPNGAIAVQDDKGRVLGFYGKGERYAGIKLLPLAAATSLENPWLQVLRDHTASTSAELLELGGPQPEKFVVARHVSVPIGGASFRIVVFAPISDFLGPFKQAEKNVIAMSVLLLLVLMPLVWLTSRPISRVLRGLARDSEQLKRLDFSNHASQPPTYLYEINALGEAQHVMRNAIRQRTVDLEAARQKLDRLVQTGIELSREKDRVALLKNILHGTQEICQCAAATLFLKTEHDTLAFALRTNDLPLPAFEIPLFDANGAVNDKFVVVHAAVRRETVVIDDVYRETRFDLSGTKNFSEESGFRSVSMLTVPLCPNEHETIGLIQLLNATDPETGEIIPFDPDIIGFVEAMAAQSAIALENQNLIASQKALLDALIKLIANAIDAKSPYTGGHCERVPELAFMLVDAASAVTEGPLADFRFKTEDEWTEFRIGAWLHDCGKVTTPEYVVDKATKLETIYNRIHEVRTRFEVLLRDADIERLTAIHEQGVPRAEAEARFAARRAQLAEDFAFVADANVGGEFMAPERIERIQRLAEETWVRHFDDRLGLSQEELRRCAPFPAADLPVREPLLADKPWHVVPRVTSNGHVLDERYGWKVKIPDNLYHFGELYNLCIGRGTLTDEERFKINEHIIQTIVMLEQLPLPKHLKRIPEYAGTHHETMIGTGYPRRLKAEDLSIPARIMAIADIFEALTASDRPYKPMKTLSECIRILSFFKKDQHIDPVLFDLFLTSGVYLRYAERYLKPEQIDAVDIAQYLTPTAAPSQAPAPAPVVA